MINLTSPTPSLLNQKRTHINSDINLEFSENSSQGDTLTKCNPLIWRQKKMSMDTYDETTINYTGKIGCNCKNSQCLKRYCECFSRMKYCDSSVCCCKNCFNTIERKEERDEVIQNLMLKSPISFKKISMDETQLCCSCKKSFCLKKYCECYQSYMKCSSNCKCIDCHNGMSEKKLFSVTRGSSSEKKRDRFYSVESWSNMNKQIIERRIIMVEPEHIIIDNYDIKQIEGDMEMENYANYKGNNAS